MKVAQSCPTLCDPMDYSPWNSPGQNTAVGSLSPPSPKDLPNTGIEPRSLALQVASSPAEPSRKPKNTGMGSLSLLQWIFLTQELNQGLLHCRQILYQLSYQGSLLLVYRGAINVNFLLLILASVGGTCLQLLLWCLSF